MRYYEIVAARRCKFCQENTVCVNYLTSVIPGPCTAEIRFGSNAVYCAPESTELDNALPATTTEAVGAVCIVGVALVILAVLELIVLIS